MRPPESISAGPSPGGAGRKTQPGSRWAVYRRFALRALREPGTVGAVAPSSHHLAREMAAVVPSSGAPVVVELGPGTGALSPAISERLPARGRHLAVELDTGMVEYLRANLPWLDVVQGDAAELSSLLRDHGIDRVDAVVSGLPWSLFSAELQKSILSEVGAVLAPAGAFTTFAYVHALKMSGARAFRSRVDAAFDEVVTTRAVWRNAPPACTYVCRRPVEVG